MILISTHARGGVRRVDRASPALGFLAKSELSADAIEALLGRPARATDPSDLASARGRTCPQLEGISDRRRCRGVRRQRGRVRRDDGGGAVARGDRARRPSGACCVRGGVGFAAWRLGPLVRRPVGAGCCPGDRFVLHRALSVVRLGDWVNYLVTAMYIAIGVFVGAILEATRRRAATSETARGKLAEEQAALRRVATLDRPGRPARGGVRRGRRGDARPRRGRRDADHSLRTRRTATLVGGTGADDRPAPARTGRARSRDRGGVADGRTARIDDFGGVSSGDRRRAGLVPRPPPDRRSRAR